MGIGVEESQIRLFIVFDIAVVLDISKEEDA